MASSFPGLPVSDSWPFCSNLNLIALFGRPFQAIAEGVIPLLPLFKV